MSLKELLDRTKRVNSEQGSYYTHVSLFNPKGTFQIELDDLELFWQQYSRALQAQTPVGIAEMPQKFTGVVVDIDLHADANQDTSIGNRPLYMPEDITGNIKTITNLLIDELEIVDETVLTCAVFEKPGYVSGGQYRNGYHLQYPFLFVEGKWLKGFLKKLADIVPGVDEQTPRLPWLLYGSSKGENKSAYTLTRVYSGYLKEQNISVLSKYPVYDSYGHQVIIPESDVHYYLPRILSIIPMHRKITRAIVQKTAPIEPPLLPKLPVVETPTSNIENLVLASKLLCMLSNNRAANRDSWIRCGWILHNLSRGNREGLNIWINFSRRAPDKFSEAVCEAEWLKMVPRYGLTLGTLFYWASQDSPQQCEMLKQERRELTLKRFISGTHNEIAKFLKQRYGDEFICVDIKRNIWYQCVGGLWVKLADPYTLRKRLSNEVACEFNSMQHDIISAANRNLQDNMKSAEALQKQVRELVKNLCNSNFKRHVLQEAADEFYEPDFMRSLDNNPYLIGFQNGVYDLKGNIFRNFCPEDGISKRLPIEYKVFSEDDVPYVKMLDFLRKIFPDRDVRKYFLDVYSEIFVGGNHAKQIYFWTGYGDNGKTVTQTLFEKMLGSHAIKISTTFFSGKKLTMGTAAPELSRAAPPVRLITLDEPDSREVLNVGYLKQFSGNDKYWARDLYQSGADTHEVTPFFKITFICNRLPALDNPDEATFARLRVIPFESTFRVETACPKTITEQEEAKIFPKNPKIFDDLEDIAVAFAYYLLQWRKAKNSDTIIEPLKVIIATTNYRERNDYYLQFVRESLVETTTRAESLTEAEMFELFKLWANQKKLVASTRDEFIHYMSMRWPNKMFMQIDLREQVKNKRVIVA